MGLRAASGDAALAKAVRRNYRFITRVANSLGAELNPVYGYARHYRPGLCAGVEHPAAPYRAQASRDRTHQRDFQRKRQKSSVAVSPNLSGKAD